MKLLVFAHTPPPHHGQSYMVKLMLDGFGGDRRKSSACPASPHGIECYHVNARLSTHLEDIGDIRVRKLGLLLWYCLQAIWCRFRYGVTTFYYVPAPGKTSALVRDWLVFALCRPFFKRIILHWHAAGMAKWIETSTNHLYRDLTYRSIGQADLCLVLSRYNLGDAEKLWPRRIRIVGNGIPDPCPDFEQAVLPRRKARLDARKAIVAGESLGAADVAAAGGDPQVFKMLFLAHCIREKGLFDTLDGVALAVARLLRDNSPMDLRLTVAGEFMNADEEAEFRERIRQPDLLDAAGQSRVTCVGFVSGEKKRDAFLQADCFCFPTCYYAESFGLVVVEAMSFGVPVVTSRWRSLPELLPADYNGLVNPKSPDQIADAIARIMVTQDGGRVRQIFVRNYRLDRHLDNLAAALHTVEHAPDHSIAQAPAAPAHS
jgi:glycosyltransferase involved in cell wall biosynthesis